MRIVLGVLFFLLAVAAGAVASDDGVIDGLATRHGFPVRARVELRRIATIDPGMPPGLARPLFAPEPDERPWVAGPPLAVRETDERGAFRFDGLPPARYEVRTRTVGGVAREECEIDLPGRRMFVRLALEPEGRVVRGRLVWADGSPFRGDVATRAGVVDTDEAGRFAVPIPEHGARAVAVRAAGRLRRRVHLPDGDGKTPIVVDAGLVARTGRVLDAETGRPLAGARLGSDSLDIGIGVGSVTTGAVTGDDGRFRLPTVPEAAITARAGGRLARTVRPASDVGPIEIRLPRSPVVAGRAVKAADRTPLPGVPVVLMSLLHSSVDMGGFAMTGGARALTDREGRFVIESPVAGDVMVFVFGRGWITTGLEEATNGGYNPAGLTLAPGERRELTLVAVPSPSLSGRVTEPDGQPAPGVVVSARNVNDASGAVQWRMGWLDDLTRAITGPDGRFRIATVMPDVPVDVWTETYHRLDARADPVTPRPGAKTRVDLVFPEAPPDRYVTVTVVAAADGSPVPGARVRIETAEADWPDLFERLNQERIFETTGPDGRARVGPFSRRPLFASVRHDAHPPRMERPVPGTDADAAVISMKVALDPGHTIRGVARFPDGRPVAHAGLVFRREGAGAGSSCHETDGEGRFRATDLTAGEWEVRVSASLPDGTRWSGSDHAIADGKEEVVVVVLDEVESEGPPAPRWAGPPRAADGPGLDVRITTADGSPVAAGRLLVRRGTDEHVGFAEPVELSDGRAHVALGKRETHAFVDVRPAAPAGLGAALAGPFTANDSPVRIVVGPALAIAGRVRTADGAGMRGVRVWAYPLCEALLDLGEDPDPHGATWTDEAGRFRIAGLGAGRYVLGISGPEGLRQEAPVVAAAGEEDVEVRLAPAARPTIVVLDAEGRPLAEASVHVHPPDAKRPLSAWNAIASGTTDSRGVVRLGGLDPEARYRLVIDAPYEPRGLEDREVADWKPADGTWRLTAIWDFAGAVRDRDGYPVLRARVWRLFPTGNDEGNWRRVPLDEEGRFEFRELPREPLRLRVGPPRAYRQDDDVLPFTIDPGEPRKDFVIDGGPALTIRVEDWPAEKGPGRTIYTAELHCEAEIESWPVGPDGRLRVHGIIPDLEYGVRIRLPDDRIAWAETLRLDGENLLKPVPGASIGGRLELPEGARAPSLTVRFGRLCVEARVGRDGSFHVDGLPPGTVSLSARAIAGGVVYTADYEVETGLTVDVPLRPK